MSSRNCHGMLHLAVSSHIILHTRHWSLPFFKSLIKQHDWEELVDCFSATVHACLCGTDGDRLTYVTVLSRPPVVTVTFIAVQLLCARAMFTQPHVTLVGWNTHGQHLTIVNLTKAWVIHRYPFKLHLSGGRRQEKWKRSNSIINVYW